MHNSHVRSFEYLASVWNYFNIHKYFLLIQICEDLQYIFKVVKHSWESYFCETVCVYWEEGVEDTMTLKGIHNLDNFVVDTLFGESKHELNTEHSHFLLSTVARIDNVCSATSIHN